MSPFHAAHHLPMHRAARLALDHDDIRPPLLSDPSNPSQRHDVTSASLHLNHMQTTRYTLSPSHDSQPRSLPERKRARMPDWSEFYRNGAPREVIVIQDTPEPRQDLLKDIPGDTPKETPKEPSKDPSKDCSHAPPVLMDSVAMPQPVALVTTRKRKYERASLDEPGHAAAAKPSPSSSNAPPSESKSTPQDPEALQKRRRRTRLQQEIESSLEHRLPGATEIKYRGLSSPVIRVKNVNIRHDRRYGEFPPANLADENGHFCVVPDTALSSQYQIVKLLGQGTFGKVVSARWKRTNELVAIKIIRSVQKYREAAKIELRVLKTLRHNDAENKYRCIHLRDCFDFWGHTCIVMDLLSSSLFDFLKANSFVPFPNSHIQSFAKQLLTSVAFLHDLGLTHTDLKPENILLRDAAYQTFTYDRTVPSCRTAPSRIVTQRRVLFSSEIRLVDFGSATFHDEHHSSVVSTRHYRAPEIILGIGWSYPCDIWSIGCILVEFFTGDALFQTHDNLEHLAMMEAVLDSRIDLDMVRQVNKMTKGNAAASYFKRLKLNYPASETSRASRRFVKSMKRLEDIIPKTSSFLRSFLDLLQKMFVYDPAHRITAKQALLHPWFQEATRDDGTEAAKIAIERGHVGEHESTRQ